jgi:transcriptional regulator with XRE-family HTH domain
MPQLRLRKVFASNMRTLRLAKKLSQEELADACGLHRTYVGSVERAERNVSIDNMEKIANALGVSVEELVRKS